MKYQNQLAIASYKWLLKAEYSYAVTYLVEQLAPENAWSIGAEKRHGRLWHVSFCYHGAWT
jgi:hypothetical protein